MDPAKLAKIKALAEDARGDPKLRAIAQRFFDENKPSPSTPKSNIHPGLRTSQEYERFLFMNLANWGKSKTGNYVHDVSWNGALYTIILFKHKQTPTYGWLRTHGAAKAFSGKYGTLVEAHRSAWDSLTKMV